MSRILLGLTALISVACASSPPLVDCTARENVRPLCGYQNPEDLVSLPSGHALIVSEYGRMNLANPGYLSRLDLADEKRTELFRAGDAEGATAEWGDPVCPGPPEVFSPHGIDLALRDDGRTMLLVVNHAGRESVEFFEVLDPGARATVAWRGCAVPPEGSWLNDVAARSNGGFYVTHMMPMRGTLGQAWELIRAALFASQTGHVIAWEPGGEYSVVAGSEAAFPNGISLSADGERIYLNEIGEGRVRGLEVSSGRTLGSTPVTSPDNSTWAPDGRLLVASLTASLRELQACNSIETGACPASFAIVAIDPATFQSEELYVGDGVTMGAGTVGLQVRDELFIGSFAGDRILRVRLEQEGSSR